MGPEVLDGVDMIFEYILMKEFLGLIGAMLENRCWFASIHECAYMVTHVLAVQAP
jgi:hypothetical protein